ncbi:MAG: 50S ribosomal protein L4 [Candidatus Nomurabacteria bacterium]|jgi:large subunit ribosomal protein L4|nr:50S ribosomal protein L4 [Candidatus Nomurabacteria bacterium]
MSEIKLNPEIFEIKVENHELLKLAYDAYLANSRSAQAKTLKRGEVRGGGKKPWKQKGTGRARFGSTRNPIWRHGGIVWGPTGNENYTKSLSKTAKRTAVAQALSLALADKTLAIVPDFAPKDGKVKETLKFLADNKLAGRVLLVVAEKTELVLRATGNVADLKVVRPTYLTVFDLLNADKVALTESSVKMIEEWLIGGTNA